MRRRDPSQKSETAFPFFRVMNLPNLMKWTIDETIALVAA